MGPQSHFLVQRWRTVTKRVIFVWFLEWDFFVIYGVLLVGFMQDTKKTKISQIITIFLEGLFIKAQDPIHWSRAALDKGLASASCATAVSGRASGCPHSLSSRTTPNGTPASRAGGSLSCASRWSSGIPCGFCVTGHQGLPFRFKRKSWNPRNGFPDGLPVFEFSDWDLNSNSKNSKPELPGGKPVILTGKCRKIWKNSGKSPSHMKKFENLAEFPLIMCILTVYNV